MTYKGHLILSRIKEPAKADTCARDRRALQQLALNVHVKHSDLTWAFKTEKFINYYCHCYKKNYDFHEILANRSTIGAQNYF